MRSTDSWRLGYQPSLDGLRGIAIALVVLSHVWDESILNEGPVGVTLFFVLSGFLITSLLLEEQQRNGSISLRGFYARRARRLLPAALVMIGVVGAFQTAIGLTSGITVVSILLYSGNWLAAYNLPMGLLSHTWSLAVEEQYYLLWPLVLIALARARAGRVVLLKVALLGAAISVIESVALWCMDAGDARIYYASDTRAAPLLAGCALAALMHGRQVRSVARPVVPASALLVLLAAIGAVNGAFGHAMLAPLATFAVAPFVISLLVRAGDVGFFSSPPLRYLGSRSYGLYLWHVPILYGVEIFAGRALLARVLSVAGAVLITELSWRYVEQPMMLRRRSIMRLPAPDNTASHRYSSIKSTASDF